MRIYFLSKLMSMIYDLKYNSYDNYLFKMMQGPHNQIAAKTYNERSDRMSPYKSGRRFPDAHN